MPNWCMNNLTIEHDDIEKVNEFAEAYKRGETCEHYLPTPKRDDGELSDDWWDYRVNNWGTKWDFGGEGEWIEQDGNMVRCSYDTAWAPPIGLYERLQVLGFYVRASYFEPGLSFAGTWIDGEDYHCDGECVDDFPQDLVEEYNMTEWYEDDEDDDAPFKLVSVPKHPES
jgi:hypothetical protein